MRAEGLMEIEIKNRVNDQQLANQYDKTNLFYFYFPPYQMHSINQWLCCFSTQNFTH
jgi:hypothetical protein